MMADIALWMLTHMCGWIRMAALLQIGYVVGSSLLALGLTFQGALYWVRCLSEICIGTVCALID